MPERTCLACGQSLPAPSKYGPPSNFCSRSCRYWWRKNSGAVEGSRPAGVRKASPRPPERRSCQLCGGEFMAQPSSAQRFCSLLCANRRPEPERIKNRWPGVEKICPCGETFVAKSGRAKHCPNCKPRMQEKRPCLDCGAAVRGAHRCRTCASHHVTKLRLAALGREWSVETKAAVRSGSARIPKAVRTMVYERDGWTCQLCFEPVDRILVYPDLWSASIDHIACVSWTDEPDNSPGNLRLAHLWCNSVRSDESYYTDAVLRVDFARSEVMLPRDGVK